MTGSIAIAGLGPGSASLITPEVTDALGKATDIVGYAPYVSRVPHREGVARHATDNREELDRSRHALTLAAEGKRVVVVSSGDPGVFAMAAALFEAVEAGPDVWRNLDIQVLPGVTAMLAAAARVGAPLGHDFCAINLSDNLKPWAFIEKRLRLATEADFAIALYNPRSKARPERFSQALKILRSASTAERPVICARAVSSPEEQIRVISLGTCDPDLVDMRTIVIIGSSATRVIDRNGGPYVYTPRSAGA